MGTLGMAPEAAGGSTPLGGATVEMLLREIQTLRATQMQILELLRRNAAPDAVGIERSRVRTPPRCWPRCGPVAARRCS